jgi:hypothetical protein
MRVGAGEVRLRLLHPRHRKVDGIDPGQGFRQESPQHRAIAGPAPLVDAVYGRDDASSVIRVINCTLYRNLSPRLKATMLSVCAAGFTLATMFGLGFAAGVGVDPELRYLSPGRQPTSGIGAQVNRELRFFQTGERGR